MIDCGLFQGTKTIRQLNYSDFPFKPETIDYLMLTHAHIDHTGLVPKLYANGFRNPIHATRATADLMAFMLPDSGFIQESEVERLNRRNKRRGRPQVTPIYTQADAQAVLTQINDQPMDEWFEPGPGVKARYWNAGHILGSAVIELAIDDSDAGRPLRLLFSGDLGPNEKAFHDVPSGPSDVDYLFVESTYGDRDREDLSLEARRNRLGKEINAGLEQGGKLLIPAFAVERTQEILYSILGLMDDGKIPNVPVFIDSPLATKVTSAFSENLHDLVDIDMRLARFDHPNINFTVSVDESKAINSVKGPAIIMAASGMCDAGRIRHHLKNHLWKQDTTVLFVGYQSPGTLGHIILQGEKEVRIHGETVAVNAQIRRIDSYSAHADQGELLAWVKERLPVRQGVFLVHGDEDAMQVFKTHLAEAGLNENHIHIPELDEQFDLTIDAKVARHKVTERLTPEEARAQEDWHNTYARLILDLGRKLDELPNGAARNELLQKLRDALKPA